MVHCLIHLLSGRVQVAFAWPLDLDKEGKEGQPESLSERNFGSEAALQILEW